MSRILVVFLLICLSGCRSGPIAPEVISGASSEPMIIPGEDEDEIGPTNTPRPELRGNITKGIALVSSNVLHVRCTVGLPEDDWTYQVFMNTDNNGYTGSQGFDYVARGPGLDPFAWVVRTTRPDASQPAGFGRVTGHFTSQWVGNRHQLKMQIPLSSIPDCYQAGKIRVVFYTVRDKQVVPIDQLDI